MKKQPKKVIEKLIDEATDYIICLEMESGQEYRFNSINDILFSHDFAKAIWGEDCKDEKGEEFHKPYDFMCSHNWIEHLQQAVISEDPLQYYWDNK